MFNATCRGVGTKVPVNWSRSKGDFTNSDLVRRFHFHKRNDVTTTTITNRLIFMNSIRSSNNGSSWNQPFRHFSTTKFPFATPGTEDTTTKQNDDETTSQTPTSLSPLPLTPIKSKRLLTVVEPTVRRKPFQNYRHSASSKRTKPNTKRIFVDTIMNSGDQHHKSRPQLQQRDIFGGSTTSTMIKPGSDPGSYPVIAIQVARSIDLSKVISKVFATKGIRKMRERLSVVAQLPPSSTGTEINRFVAVFQFGSVVFFNVSPKDIATLVDEIKTVSTGQLVAGNECKDRFCVHVQPPHISSRDDDEDLDEVTADYCIVPELNMKSVDVISNVMAQSVALDAYNEKVDELLADFERINHKVTIEGNLSPVDRDKMFRAVAQNNSIFLKLSKVGIKDRVDTAWNLSQYETVSEGMRDEFDIDRRFEHIEFKLNLIQQNAKFFLEVLANQKSDSLEWIIIVLILLECVLMCIEMSGMGEPSLRIWETFCQAHHGLTSQNHQSKLDLEWVAEKETMLDSA